MAAYIIADITVLNPELYEDYRRQVPALIEKYGGRFLARGAASEVLEGNWQPSRLIILEFPDMDTLQRYYRSDDYQVFLRIRQSAAQQDRRGGGGVSEFGLQTSAIAARVWFREAGASLRSSCRVADVRWNAFVGAIRRPHYLPASIVANLCGEARRLSPRWPPLSIVSPSIRPVEGSRRPKFP